MTQVSASEGVPINERRGFVLLAATIARCAVFLEITIVGVAITTMVRDLDITTSTAAWTVTAYTLALAAAVVPLGRLGDRVGHRRLLVVALVALAVTSVLCAAAPNFTFLLVARVLQGFSAAALMPSTQALVANSYPPEDRTKALGRMQGAQALVFASGPVIGGLLIAGPGWRWVFAIIAPLALVGLGLILAFVPNVRVERTSSGLDLLPSFLLAMTASAFVIAGVQLGGTTPAMAVVWVAVAAVVGWLFVRADRRTAAPLLDPELLGRRRYRAGLLGGFLYQYGLLAISVVLLTYFQVGLDLSPQAAGIAFLPVSVPLLAATWVAPLVKRFGARKVVTVGLVTMATASLVTGVLALERQYLLMIPCLVLVGLGIALTGVPVQALTVAELPESKRGLSGAGLALVRQLGGAFGVAFLVTVATVMERLRVDAIVRGLSSVEASDLESLLAGRPSAQASLGALPDAGRQLVQTDASQTIAVATCIALVVGGLLSLVGTLLVWRLLAGPQPDLDSLDDLEPAVE